MEMQQMIERNFIEYLSEGYNWESVIEEDEFIMHGNKLIHPAHYNNYYNNHHHHHHAENYCNLQQQFCMILKAHQREGL